MFERPSSGERAVLVHVGIGEPVSEVQRKEFEQLALSAGAELLSTVATTRRSAHPRLLIGSGKADELGAMVAALRADIVLFNNRLSPSQERNLERVLKCRVLDRSGLILDIFAQRARSFEGKLQVELAQLRHLSTRLVRGWTHLERQKGGIGLRGPGEKQLESDRRMLGRRIKTLNRRLGRVARQRSQERQTRHKAEVPTVSLVGYTNAGKSTLFNLLTGAKVYVADQLFATLDPTLRRLNGSHAMHLVVADTVGFMRDLPHELVAAFRATLLETREANLLLHVIDAHDEQRDARVAQVNEILDEVGAGDVPQIEVFNKIDLSGARPHVDRDAAGRVSRVWLSAQTSAGLELLNDALSDWFRPVMLRGVLCLEARDARMRSRLFDLGAVRNERLNKKGQWELEVEIPERFFQALCRHEGLTQTLHEGGVSPK